MERIKMICQYNPKNNFSISNHKRGIDQGGHLGFNFVDTNGDYYNKSGYQYNMDKTYDNWEKMEYNTGFFIKLKYKD